MTRPRIMVVDDEVVIAEDISMSLEELGYEVCAIASSGNEAVRLADESHPDLVVMDVVLRGDMDGVTAAARIRAHLRIPIVYLTAYADEEMLERASLSEPFGYLIKPFREQELHSTIKMALLRHQLENQLRVSREWFSGTLRSIADAVIATDPGGRVIFMNPVAETLTGVSQNSATGRPLSEVFQTVTDADGDAHEGFADKLLHLDADVVYADCDYELVAADGFRMAVDPCGAPIRNPEGKIIGWVLVFRDISERRRWQERIRLLSEAVEQSSEGIMLIDLDGSVRFVNRAFAAMHGYTPEAAMGKHYSVFHSQQQFPAVDEAFREIQTRGHFAGELWHCRADGSVFPGLVHNSILRNHRGVPIGLIVTLRDVTDLKEAGEKLRASHEALETKVAERTRDLEHSRQDLRRYSESLEKTNEALKIVIAGIEGQKREVQEKVAHNLNLTVMPIIEELKHQEMSDTVKFLLESLEFNLSNMFSSFGFNITNNDHRLTPREIRVCELIRSGLSSKQIAKTMSISPQTVLVHRKNIRKKLGMDKSRRNLATFLKTRL